MSIWDEATKVEDIEGHGIWRHYTFANGYGAAVIQTSYSFGGPEGYWELATRDAQRRYRFLPGITDPQTGIAGWLTQADAETLLTKIKAISHV